VVREIRAAAPLMAQLRAPVPARGPWLTAVLNDAAARRFAGRPVAVVVEAHAQGRPEAAAFLLVRRRGPLTIVTMLGEGLAPPGAPGARLLARDDAAAGLLAAGMADLLGTLPRPRRLRLSGLPLGDPTARHLKARFEDAVLATGRTRALVDDLDDRGPVTRSRDARELERWLPALETGRGGEFRRASARLHAAIGQLELAVIADGDRPRAALLTLVDGAERRPWWGFADDGPLSTVPGSPSVSFSAPAGNWPPVPRLRGSGGGR
jgi:hypothetical protein